MSESLHAGGCHCGALRWEFGTAQPLQSFTPRSCDCDYCSRHRAAWVSDAAGRLQIHADSAQLQLYHQGSGQAEFLICRNCGVLVAVIARADDGRLLGAINRNALDARVEFHGETTVSPQPLAPEIKLERWTQLWTPTQLQLTPA